MNFSCMHTQLMNLDDNVSQAEISDSDIPAYNQAAIC